MTLCCRLALKTVRFFGKFLGLYADYYVFEVRAKAGPAKDEEAEKKLAEGGSRSCVGARAQRQGRYASESPLLATPP